MFAVVATLAAACVEDPKMDGSAQGENAVVTKIVNTSENASKGELILYVDDATAELWSAEKAITRSSDSALASIAQEVGAESVEQVFNMAMNAEVKRARGMHRWFVVKFDQEANLDVVAQKFAQLPSVSKIQFSTIPQRPQVAARPIKEVPMTRVEEMPYNDPMLSLQWHYDNRGSKKISQTAKEGEDIGAFGAWQYTTGNREIIVAVVDEGVKYNHPDLEANMWVNEAEKSGQPGIDDDNNGWVDDIYGVNTWDENGNISWDVVAWREGYYAGDTGHGTHVAGTIAAVNNNALGVSGVAGGSGKGDGPIYNVEFKQITRMYDRFLYDASPDAVFCFAARIMPGYSVYDRVFLDVCSRQRSNALPNNAGILLQYAHDNFVKDRFEHFLI